MPAAAAQAMKLVDEASKILEKAATLVPFWRSMNPEQQAAVIADFSQNIGRALKVRAAIDSNT